MPTPNPIGSLMGYAEQEAAVLRFQMDATYRARLARSIKLELKRGTNYDDIKLALRELLRRRLSPGLLKRKVEDLHGPSRPVPEEPDPYAPFPTWSQED